MDVKILVATHKPYYMPEESCYLPLHVGCEGKKSIGFLGDNTGENISLKNDNYCELTGIYWAWKNLKNDYIGLCHYRRYFTNGSPHGINRKRDAILLREDFEKILLSNNIIVPSKRRYYIETNRSHYNHAHNAHDLDMTEDIIRRMYPQYIEAFEMVMNRTWAHMFNMFVMRKDYFDDYCAWFFSVLFELETRIDIKKYNKYEARVFGFIAELLLDVWIEKNHFKYKEQNVSFMEKQNWLIKGSKFLIRKFI